MICDTDNTGYLPKDEIEKILKANFLAQAATTQDIQRRVKKIFEKAHCKNKISGPRRRDICVAKIVVSSIPHDDAKTQWRRCRSQRMCERRDRRLRH